MLDASAYDLLGRLPAEVDASEVIEKIIARKKDDSASERRITNGDLELFLPTDSARQGEAETAAPPDLEPSLEVMVDPTPRVAPMKADEGYKRLFRDRYEHLLSIVQKRPDTRGLVTAQSAKGVAAGQGKKKVAGLLSSRVERRGNLELTIDDPTGALRIICPENLGRLALRLPLDSL